MPKARAGQMDWIELTTSSHFVYLPMLLRAIGTVHSALPPDTAPTPARVQGLELSGYQVAAGDGQVYTIPAALPPVPVGAFVLIYYRHGADDYDFGLTYPNCTIRWHSQCVSVT